MAVWVIILLGQPRFTGRHWPGQPGGVLCTADRRLPAQAKPKKAINFQ